MSNSFIWAIDTTLSGAITPAQSGPGSDGNEGVLYIPQSFSITGASPSDCLMSYPGHSLGGGEGLAPLPRCSWCILQPQPTRQVSEGKKDCHYIMLIDFKKIFFFKFWSNLHKMAKLIEVRTETENLFKKATHKDKLPRNWKFLRWNIHYKGS